MSSANNSTNEEMDEDSYVLNQAEETSATPIREEKEGEPRFWEIFNSVSDGLFQIDLEGNFVLVNTAFAAMIGYKPEELRSRNVKMLQEYVSEEEIKEILTEITKKGRINERLIRLPQPDGSVKWIEVSIGMRRGKNGDSIGFEGIVRDVTDRFRYERRLEALHWYATRIGSSTSVEEVAELTFDTIEQTLGFNLGSFSIVEGDLLREIHTRGVKTYTLFKLSLDGRGITVRAVRTGQTQLITDIREDDDYIRGPAEGYYEPLSELDVPVKVDGKVIAVINIESTKLNAFTDEDRKLVEILAGHVASTVQKIRLLEMERHYKAKIEALHRHASELASAVTIDEVAKTTLNAIEGVLGFPSGAFSIVKDDLLIPIYLKGIDIGSNRSLPLDGPGIVVRAVNTRESQLVSDTRKDKDYILAIVDGKNQTLSELAVPVVVNSEVKAVFNVESEKLNAFNEEDRRLLEIFAEHVASTLGRLSEVERLRRSEEKFRTLLEESMDAATLIVGTTIIYANKRMAELVGLRDASEVIGRSSLDFVADEDKEIVRTRTLGRQRGEKHVNLYEFQMQTTDGKKIDVETYVSLIEYEGRPASLAFTRNVSERKKMERELRDYTERLEEMVEERTRKLREAERMAAIGELAAMIGHDLRNPLTGIAGATYFLKTKYGSREDDTVKKMLEIIENDIEYSNKIINDLLEYSRSINLELSATNSKRLIDEALETFKVPENIQILNLAREKPDFEVDVQKMRRVILNLISNAIDAMPSGGEITIRSKATKEHIELYFTDNGKGIPEEIIDKIWKPLFTTKAKGMGFGLSICKRVVESHGGTISVKSKLGEGATFIITLPLVR